MAVAVAVPATVRLAWAAVFAEETTPGEPSDPPEESSSPIVTEMPRRAMNFIPGTPGPFDRMRRFPRPLFGLCPMVFDLRPEPAESRSGSQGLCGKRTRTLLASPNERDRHVPDGAPSTHECPRRRPSAHRRCYQNSETAAMNSSDQQPTPLTVPVALMTAPATA